MTTRSMDLKQPTVLPEKLGFMRFGDVDDWKVLTNDAGEWHTLSSDDFHALMKGEIGEDHEEYRGLQRKGFDGRFGRRGDEAVFGFSSSRL